MPPKNKPVERDSLPKRPTDSMMDPTKTTTQTAATVKTTETTKITQESVKLTKSSSKDSESDLNIMVLPYVTHKSSIQDGNQAGWLSIKHLNNLLLRYIGVVHDLEEDSVGEENGEFNIKIDKKEMNFLEGRYKEEIEEWDLEQKRADEQIKKLQAEITKLKLEVEALKKSGNEFDDTIKKKEKEIEDLRKKVKELQASINQFLNQQNHFHALIARLQGEIGFLEGEINSTMAAFQAEEIRGDDLGDRLKSIEAEHRVKMKVLETELSSEQEKTSVDISSMDVRIKGEYINRLMVEIEILRGTYDEFKKTTQEKLEDKYKDKLTKLELDLRLALSRHVSSEDIEKIRIQISELQIKIKELTESNQKLSATWSKLSVELHEEEARFNAQMSKKEREIEHYRRETERFQEMLAELNRRLLEERAEVYVYDRLLTPEYERMKTRHKSGSKTPTRPTATPTGAQ